MIRAAVVTATAVMVTFGLTASPVAMADPATTYMFGACFTPDQPVVELPTTIMYGCDGTSSMQDMTWTAWGADGADGTGTDNSVESQPNCAQGPLLTNPIVVHAWNPLPASSTGCPPNVPGRPRRWMATPPFGADRTPPTGRLAIHNSSSQR